MKITQTENGIIITNPSKELIEFLDKCRDIKSRKMKEIMDKYKKEENLK